ncbi:MAG: trigger factor [Acidobacteriota bacterium]
MSAEEQLKIEVSQLNSCRRELRIEVPAQVVTQEIDRTIRRVARSVRLPGFRKGKAPLPMVRSRYRKAIEEEALEQLLQHSTRNAIEQEGLRPLQAPRVSGLDYKPGEPLSFRAVFEVRPEVEPKKYEKLGVKMTREPVMDEQVDERLEALRQAAARLVPVEDRSARHGDILLVDMRWWRGNRRGKPTERDGAHIELGSQDQHPEFNKALEGAEPGQTLDLEIDYPEDYRAGELAGAHISYRLKVRALKQRQVPALDDALARQLGDYADLAALRAEVHRRLEVEASNRARQEAVGKLIDRLLEANPIEVPEVMVEAQIDDQFEEVAHSLAAQGVRPEQIKIDWAAERQRLQDSARRSVAARLLLDAIAEHKQIAVPAEELERKLEQEAKRLRLTPASLRARLENSGGISALEHQMRRERVLDFLLTGANI